MPRPVLHQWIVCVAAVVVCAALLLPGLSDAQDGVNVLEGLNALDASGADEARDNNANPPPIRQAVAEAPVEPPRSRTVWYVLGSALAVAVVAGLVGGSGGQGGEDDCCEVRLVVEPLPQ